MQLPSRPAVCLAACLVSVRVKGCDDAGTVSGVMHQCGGPDGERDVARGRCGMPKSCPMSAEHGVSGCSA